MQILHPAAATTAHTGVLRSTYHIASTEGFFSLWRGMSSVIVGAGMEFADPFRVHFGQALTIYGLAGPAHAVYFATYEAVKHAMGGNKAGEHHPLAAGE
jgi:hypothetical protein